jgi:hypothetical protein
MRPRGPNNCAGARASDWNRITATSPQSADLPTPRTTTKETSSPKSRSPPESPLNGSREEARLLQATEERHGHFVLTRHDHFVLAAEGLVLAMEESRPSLTTPSPAEEGHLDPLATLSHVASAPAATCSQSLTTPGSAAHSSCLPVLRPSTAYPMSSSASVTHSSHPRLHPPY